MYLVFSQCNDEFIPNIHGDGIICKDMDEVISAVHEDLNDDYSLDFSDAEYRNYTVYEIAGSKDVKVKVQISLEEI